MKTEQDFDFSAELMWAGGRQAELNWAKLKEHTIAEWSDDLDGTMATMTRNDPFQIMHPTGLHVRGWENVRDYYKRRMETFTGQGFHARQWLITDKVIAGNGYFSGTPSGSFLGVESHGKPLHIPMALWIYFEDGLVKGEEAFFDGAELSRQLRDGGDASKAIVAYPFPGRAG